MKDDAMKQALRRALDEAEPTRREAADDFDAVMARAGRRGASGALLALAGAVAVGAALVLTLRPTPHPSGVRAETPWLVVQVDVGNEVTDLRVRARF